MKNKKITLWIAAGVIVVAFIVFNNYYQGSSPVDPRVQALAQCLQDKGVKMYGAYWCPHCKSQKEMFGSSFSKIQYIECALPGGRKQTALCDQAGINTYPTWEFSLGKRVLGQLSFEELAESSGCVY